MSDVSAPSASLPEVPWTRLPSTKIASRHTVRTNEASGEGPINMEGGGLGVGRKVAVHVAGEVMAYVQGRVKVTGGGDFVPEKLKGIRKVCVNLIKNEAKAGGEDCFMTKGAVHDISFAYHFEDIILGAIDVFGNVVVSSVIVGTDMLDVFRLLTVNVGYTNPTRYHTVNWCPFINDGSLECDFIDMNNKAMGRMSRHLVVVNNSVAEVWNLDLILDKKGEPDPEKGIALNKNLIKSGRVQTAAQAHPIIDVAISPDCNFFACLLENGTTKIFNFENAIADGQPPELVKTVPNPGFEDVGDFGFITVLDDYTKEAVDDIAEQRLWGVFVIGCGRKLAVYDASMRDWPIVQRIDLSHELEKETKATKDPSGKYLLLSEYNGNKSVCLAYNKSTVVEAGSFETEGTLQHSAFVKSSKGFQVGLVSLGSSGLHDRFLEKARGPVVSELSPIEEVSSSSASSLEIRHQFPDKKEFFRPAILNIPQRISSSNFCPIEDDDTCSDGSCTKVQHLPTPIKLSSPQQIQEVLKIPRDIVKPNPIKAARSLNFDSVKEVNVDVKVPKDPNNNQQAPPSLKATTTINPSKNSAFSKVGKPGALRKPKPKLEEPELNAVVQCDPSTSEKNGESSDGIISELKDELRKLRFSQAKMPGLVKRSIQRELERVGLSRGAGGSRGETFDKGSSESIEALSNMPTFKRVCGVLDLVVKQLECKNTEAAWTILSGSRLDDLAALDVRDYVRKS